VGASAPAFNNKIMTEINLNKVFVTKPGLLNYISDYEIYKMYIGDTAINTKGRISSPLRQDDSASFGFFIGETGELCFKDFVLGSGDCVRFVMFKFGLSFFEALSQIAIDANLDDKFIIKASLKTSVLSDRKGKREDFVKTVNSNYLGKTSRNWEIRDYVFWNQFGITKPILERYNVQPVAYLHVGIEKTIVKPSFHTYCYNEVKDGINSFKIYQPENTEYKWLNNHNESVWQGWTQLPEKGDTLIITKSLKDVMSIVSVTGIPAVSLQAEGVKPKPSVIDELCERFETIYVFYDNDYDKTVNWGREFGRKLSSAHGFCQIEIEEAYKSKDFSDLVKNHGEKLSRKYLEELIERPF